MPDFRGFAKETVIFFEQLKKNNTREWFHDHKKDYEDVVKTPSMEFVTAMGKKLKEISPRINAVPQVNQSLFRLNRDTRFSPDKRPYKTHLGIWFWEGGRKRMECPGFYFHMGDGKLMLGAGMHIFPKMLLNPFRDAVVDKKLGPLLKKTLSEISKKGYVISGKHYKRIPRGYDDDHENAEWLMHNGLAAMAENKIPKEFYSDAIIDYAFSHFKNMSPLHEWLKEALP